MGHKMSAFVGLALAAPAFMLLGTRAMAAPVTVANPLCPAETALFDPGNGQDINVPPGFTVSVFAEGLNMPTGIAFLGNKNNFQVYVLESGHGLPSRCNEQGSWPGGASNNPFTPDILVFDQGVIRSQNLASQRQMAGVVEGDDPPALPRRRFMGSIHGADAKIGGYGCGRIAQRNAGDSRGAKFVRF